MEYTHSPCFRNYYYSARNLFEDVKLVKGPGDLEGLDIVIVGNNHYRGHLNIYNTNGFIDRCNFLGIRMVMFTAESIHLSYFPENLRTQKNLERFNQLTQYVIDVNDHIILGKKLMRGLMSRDFMNKHTVVEKKDKVVFIGKYREDEYSKRRNLLSSFKGVDILSYPIASWEEYMKTIGSYRFVLSPVSNGAFFPLRFYEILLTGSIPLQQVSEDLLDYYKTEASFDDCIFFETVEQLEEKLTNCDWQNCDSETWMEPHMEQLFREDGLI